MPNPYALLALAALLAPWAGPAAHAQVAGVPVQNTVTFLTPADAVSGGDGYPLAIGGTGTDRIFAVAIGPAGSTYVVGDFTGTFDFDPGPAAVLATSQGGTDFFVASYAPDGAFRFGYALGSSLNEIGTGAAIANGIAYVGGNFYGTVDFGVAGTITSQGDADGFVLAINGTTGALLWASAFGGPMADGNPKLTAGGGRVFAVARFIGPADFDDGPGSAVLNSVDSYDVALASYAASDGAYQWARVLFGGAGQQFEGGVDVGSGETVYAAANAFNNRNGIVGAYAAADGAVVFETPLTDVNPYDVEKSNTDLIVAGAARPASGGSDVFLAAYDPLSGAPVWTRTFGGSGTDQALGVDFIDEDLYVGGSFEGTVDFDPGPGTANRTSAGEADAFVALYALADGAFVAAEAFGSTGFDQAYDVDGGLTSGPVVGLFQGTVDLDPTPGVDAPRTASGPFDGFVSLYTPGGTTPVEPGAEAAGLALAAFPNPARDAATLRLTLDRPQAVSVALYDALGRRVALVHDGPLGAGTHGLRLDAAALPAGVYVVRATGYTAVVTHRLAVTR